MDVHKNRISKRKPIKVYAYTDATRKNPMPIQMPIKKLKKANRKARTTGFCGRIDVGNDIGSLSCNPLNTFKRAV